MDEKKQIEEMAFNLIMATSPLGVKDLTKQFDYNTVATDLYNLYGWRKAAEVAREIFAEIEKLIIHRMIADNPLIDDRLITDVAELKKKYESEGK